MTLSAIILIGKKVNEALLDKCIDSLEFADEIVRVNTANIGGSFSEWRNEGFKRARGEWIFYVDIDEEVTKDLKEEIIATVKTKSSNNGFAIPRRNFIFGKEFKYSGQYPDYQKRLFLKSAFHKWEGLVHEEPRFDGDLGHLKSPLIHHKDITISEMLDKTNEWSELEAELLLKSKHPKMNGIRFFSVALREFFIRMIKQMAFLDGKEGTIYALYQVYSKLITYSKLWEMQLKTGR